VEEAAKNENTAEDDDDDTTASRFTARLLRFLLKGFLAKDKAVRYRVVQLVSELVSYLGAIECV
jgi:condensin complex subunit 3